MKKKKLLVYGIMGSAILIVVTIIIYFTIVTENPWWQNKPTEWISAIGVPAAIAFSAYTIIRTRRSEKHQGLTHIFGLLDDNAHGNARRRIYNLYDEDGTERKLKILREMGLKEEDRNRVNAIHRESMEIVKADFNQIGYMVENDAILKDDSLRSTGTRS
jgi:uncharacterized protein YrzB (UPF0473 family)